MFETCFAPFRATTQRIFARCLLTLFSFQCSHDEILCRGALCYLADRPCPDHNDLRNDERADAGGISDSGAIPRATTCGLRSAMGRQDPDARQSRTERDVVFAKDGR